MDFTVSRQALINTIHGEIRLNYFDAEPDEPQKGILLLIHGFPQSSFQFRHVIPGLVEEGYRVIAPDYRGHGFSSKTLATLDWTKRSLAHELHQLVAQNLGISEKIHIVGHDIGGMIAHAYVAQFPEQTGSIVWGECPLPGTAYYEEAKHSTAHWHFDFHSHDPGMAAALVAGKERMYIQHFFDKQSWNHAALAPDVVDVYTAQYSMPDAMRNAFMTYRAFEEDAADNRAWLARNGKIGIRSMVLSGEGSWAAKVSGPMAREMYSDVTERILHGSGHYLAEENPKGFVSAILEFVQR